MEITVNNGTIRGDWKRAVVVPVYRGGDRSVVQNCRAVSLTSVVCKQMEHVIASYIRQVWIIVIGCVKGNTVSGQGTM